MSSVVILHSIVTAVIRHDIMPINQQNDGKECNSCISMRQSLGANTLFAGLHMSLLLPNTLVCCFFCFVFMAVEATG